MLFSLPPPSLPLALLHFSLFSFPTLSFFLYHKFSPLLFFARSFTLFSLSLLSFSFLSRVSCILGCLLNGYMAEDIGLPITLHLRPECRDNRHKGLCPFVHSFCLESKHYQLSYVPSLLIHILYWIILDL